MLQRVVECQADGRVVRIIERGAERRIAQRRQAEGYLQRFGPHGDLRVAQQRSEGQIVRHGRQRAEQREQIAAHVPGRFRQPRDDCRGDGGAQFTQPLHDQAARRRRLGDRERVEQRRGVRDLGAGQHAPHEHRIGRLLEQGSPHHRRIAQHGIQLAGGLARHGLEMRERIEEQREASRRRQRIRRLAQRSARRPQLDAHVEDPLGLRHLIRGVRVGGLATGDPLEQRGVRLGIGIRERPVGNERLGELPQRCRIVRLLPRLRRGRRQGRELAQQTQQEVRNRLPGCLRRGLQPREDRLRVGRRRQHGGHDVAARGRQQCLAHLCGQRLEQPRRAGVPAGGRDPLRHGREELRIVAPRGDCRCQPLRFRIGPARRDRRRGRAAAAAAGLATSPSAAGRRRGILAHHAVGGPLVCRLRAERERQQRLPARLRIKCLGALLGEREPIVAVPEQRDAGPAGRGCRVPVERGEQLDELGTRHRRADAQPRDATTMQTLRQLAQHRIAHLMRPSVHHEQAARDADHEFVVPVDRAGQRGLCGIRCGDEGGVIRRVCAPLVQGDGQAHQPFPQRPGERRVRGTLDYRCVAARHHGGHAESRTARRRAARGGWGWGWGWGNEKRRRRDRGGHGVVRRNSCCTRRQMNTGGRCAAQCCAATPVRPSRRSTQAAARLRAACATVRTRSSTSNGFWM
jgi:hypothetical protein